MKKHNGYTVIYRCGHDRTVYVNEATWYSLACAAQNQECSACFRHTINATCEHGEMICGPCSEESKRA
jgi:hypothetical protein